MRKGKKKKKHNFWNIFVPIENSITGSNIVSEITNAYKAQSLLKVGGN